MHLCHVLLERPGVVGVVMQGGRFNVRQGLSRPQTSPNPKLHLVGKSGGPVGSFCVYNIVILLEPEKNSTLVCVCVYVLYSLLPRFL